MKRLFLLLVLSFFIFSCTKEKTNSDNDIVVSGTKWKNRTASDETTIEFVSKERVVLTYEEVGTGFSKSEVGSYSISGNNISFIFTTANAKGTVAGTSMEFYNTLDPTNKVVFNKI